MLVHVFRNGGDLRVGVLPQLQNRHLALGGVGVQKLLPQPFAILGAEGIFQGTQVEGHRKAKAAVGLLAGRDHLRVVPGQIRDDPVLITPPAGEPGEPVEDPFVGGMEDMGAVLMNEHAVGVGAVVGVAADVVPALQHQHPPAAPLGQLPGRHGPGVTRTDDQTVKGILHPIHTFFRISCRLLLHFTIGGAGKERKKY